MTTHVETDWQKLTTVIVVAGVEYAVEATVFLTISHGYGEELEHFGTPCREPQTDITATLEGWASLPPCPKEHQKALEAELLEEIEQNEWL